MAVSLSLGRILCDFLVLVCIAVPLLIFHKFVPANHRGFYCDDESLRYPYVKDSKVSRRLLVVIGVLVPTFIILLVETFRASTWERGNQHLFRQYQCRSKSVHRFVVRIYTFIGYFFVGICFNQLMVDVAKYSVGRPRPYFLTICRPNVGFTDCPAQQNRYIDVYQCSGATADEEHEARLSFYSGHAAFSFYAAWYTSLYLHYRLIRPLISRLVVPTIQFALFAGAFYVSYTRISDYRHHWSDVLVGIFMGSAIGIANAFFIADLRHRRESPPGLKRDRHIQMDSPQHRAGVPNARDAESGVVSSSGVTVHIDDGRAPVIGPHPVQQGTVAGPQQVRYSTLMRGD